MYEAFFQLEDRPFVAAPNAERFYPASSIDSAHKTLTRIIERSEGAGLVIGPSGIGKTLLCQRLASDFRKRLAVASLSSGRLCTRRALLQAILYELQLPYRGIEEGELRLSLIDHLTPDRGGHAGLLLLVDEAHTLPWRLLEELRMITNLVRDGQPRVRVVLAGGPQLEERFANPKLDSFSQRIAARCYLGALNRDETAGYVNEQIKTCGGVPAQVFDASALESVYRATDGVPRLINQVCDHALILASLGGARPVDAAMVEEAWSDLQQLPAPWQSSAPAVGQTNPVIEFAALDDGPEDSPESIPFRSTAARRYETETDEQFDQIEEQLAELEDEFQPAGSIGPEVELVFEELSNPFGEFFDEEEVVIDRYASLEADLFGPRQAVASAEGRELSQLLAPWLTKPGDASRSNATTGKAAASEPAPRVAAEKSSGWPAAATRETARQEFERPVPPKLPSKAPATSAPAAEYDDADLIVIEDDAQPNTVPAPLARRQEYRQLFARLRRVN